MEPAVHRITILTPQPPAVWHRLETVLADGGSPPIAMTRSAKIDHVHVRHGGLHAARAGRRCTDDRVRSRASGVAVSRRKTKMASLSDSVVMTAEGKKALQAELEQLETVARREIADRIKTAREWGDLKENSEYHDAKNDQAHLETKILRIRERLLAAEIREVETQTDIVGFGSCVEVEDGEVRQAADLHDRLRARGRSDGGHAVDRLAGGPGAGRPQGGGHGNDRDAARRPLAEGPQDHYGIKRRRLSASTSVASSAGKCPP